MPHSHPFPRLALLGLATLLPAFAATAQVTRQADGITLRLPQAYDQALRTVRLQVVGDKIIHVQASPLDTLSTAKSLMVVPQKAPPKWQYKEKKGVGYLSTDALTAAVTLATGAVSFEDAAGHPVLQERAGGGKIFTPTVADGQPFYQIKQVFQSPADEGL